LRIFFGSSDHESFEIVPQFKRRLRRRIRRRRGRRIEGEPTWRRKKVIEAWSRELEWPHWLFLLLLLHHMWHH
jgi:hypothetical protein